MVIADHLRSLTNPDESAFYTSGRTSNEAAFLYQLMIRAFGTNNMPDCSNMCHESSDTALTETNGIGKGSVSVTDLEHADLILIAGQTQHQPPPHASGTGEGESERYQNSCRQPTPRSRADAIQRPAENPRRRR